MLTAERLRELLIYSPETGVFVWRAHRRCIVPGTIAGGIDKDGYWRIKIDQRYYTAARLAWLYMTGELPPETVDHKNCDSIDNRWENLRLADPAQQAANRRVCKNNRTGFKGVIPLADGGFMARIARRGVRRYLGTFANPEDANAAYARAAEKLDGEFARAA
jgi:hypothetical protein